MVSNLKSGHTGSNLKRQEAEAKEQQEEEKEGTKCAADKSSEDRTQQPFS